MTHLFGCRRRPSAQVLQPAVRLLKRLGAEAAALARHLRDPHQARGPVALPCSGNHPYGGCLLQQSLWRIPAAAIPMEGPCCSCKLTQGSGAAGPVVQHPAPAAARRRPPLGGAAGVRRRPAAPPPVGAAGDLHGPEQRARLGLGAAASDDANQPQVLHTSTGTCTDKTCLMLGRAPHRRPGRPGPHRRAGGW